MVMRSPLSLLFSRLNKPYSLSLSSYGRVPSPLIIFVALLWTLSACPHLFRIAGTKTEHNIPGVA